MTLYWEKECYKRLKILKKALSKLEEADTRSKIKHRRRRVLGLIQAFDNYIRREFPIPKREKDTKKQAEEALYLLIKRFFKAYDTKWHPEKAAISRLKMLTSSVDWVWYHIEPSDDLMAKIIYPTFKKRFERWQERYKNVILLEKAGKGK